MKKFAVFIDRDGTLNEEVGYINDFDKFRFLPMVTEAIRKLNQNNIPAILITNQSGVARGYFSINFLNDLHWKMNQGLEEKGCRLDGIYVCPHHPDDACACRKPEPGMLLKAAKENGISLHNSYVIGDKIIDIKLAHGVGAKGVLVLTGYGAEELKSVKTSSEDKPDHVAANLYGAVNWILDDLTLLPHYTPTPLHPTPYPHRILIIKPSSLGDIIHSLPVLWLLRKTNPYAHIGWVVKEVWKDILIDNPLLDEVIILKKGVKGLISAIRDSRTTGYDTVIDLQGLFRSGFISIMSGADKRIGFSNARELAYIFYNTKIAVPQKAMHAVDRYLLTINVIASEAKQSQKEITSGIASPHNDDEQKPHFPLYIGIEDAEWVKEFILNNGLCNVRPVIAINPSARWEKKRWPAASYTALINQLIKELKAGIIILGSKEDVPVAEEISSGVHGRHAVAAGKTSLKTLTALLKRVNLLVTNDSGPMHIAAAVNTPVVALFGPTDPGLTGPYGNEHVVVHNNMDCSPCFRRPCIHGRPLCMESITIEEVTEAVKATLTQTY